MTKNSPLSFLIIFLLSVTSAKLQSQNVEWFTLSNGLSTTAKTVAVLGNDVYVGGLFSAASGVPASRIAKWNGEAWSSLSSGVNGEVRAIAVMGNEVYVGGFFTMAGGVPVNNIAKWNGTTWSSVGTGVNEMVMALAVDGNNLYAGGFFTEAGGNPANRIAKWDGTSWQALGNGINNEVNAIAVSGNNVYAGGYFTNAGGNPAASFAKWDGSNWSTLGSGVNGFVKSIIIIENEVYIGGIFTTVNGVPANRIAKWDGASWHPLGQGLNGTVLSLKKVNDQLYVGGMFTQADNIPANRIAKYDIISSTWSAVGNGTSGGIDAMDIYDAYNSIVIVGAFGSINNNVTANYVARFRDIDNPVPVELSSFSINLLNGNPQLIWTTSSETNNLGFEVQRTAGITDWDVVGFVEGKGTTTEVSNYFFVDDNNLSERSFGFSGKYSYRLKQIDFDGKFTYSNIVEIDFSPSTFTLEQNYPNPFNPSTSIKYVIPVVETGHAQSLRVALKIFDVLGNEVTTLVNEEKSPGIYDVTWDAAGFASGVYYYTLKSGGFSETKKLMLMK